MPKFNELSITDSLQIMDSTRYLFWPQPIGPYEYDLQKIIKELVANSGDYADWLEEQLPPQQTYPNSEEYTLRFTAFLYVLLDLLRQEWHPEMDQGRLYLVPPKWTEKVRGEDNIAQHKEATRKSLSWERNRQFETASIRSFIRKMEAEKSYGGQPVSIRSLIADGGALSQKLTAILNMSESKQATEITKVIQPYLQLVS